MFCQFFAGPEDEFFLPLSGENKKTLQPKAEKKRKSTELEKTTKNSVSEQTRSNMKHNAIKTIKSKPIKNAPRKTIKCSAKNEPNTEQIIQ